MPLIDATYFDGLLILPGISDNVSRAAIDLAIAEYEIEYLHAVLGPSLHAAFAAGLANQNRSYFSAQFSSQFVKSGLDERWRWIRDGHTFTVNGRAYTWPGLLSTAGGRKLSPIANYVYWQYRVNNATTTQSGGGETVTAYENARTVSIIPKAIKVWNQMVDWNRILGIMIAHAGYYPEFQRPRGTVDVYEYQNTLNI